MKASSITCFSVPSEGNPSLAKNEPRLILNGADKGVAAVAYNLRAGKVIAKKVSLGILFV